MLTIAVVPLLPGAAASSLVARWAACLVLSCLVYCFNRLLFLGVRLFGPVL